MTYSLVAHTFSVGASGGSTTPSINTTGSDLLVVGVVYSSGHVPTLADSKSNTWTAIGSAQDSGTNACQLYFCQGGTVGSGHTFTVTGSSSFASAFVEAFSGSKASPLDQNTGANQGFSSNTIPTGSITPTQNNELIVVATVNYGSDVSQSMDSGMTVTDVQGTSVPTWGSCMGYKIQTSAAAINVTCTSNGGNRAAAVIASFTIGDVSVNLTSVSAAGAAASVTVATETDVPLVAVSASGSAHSVSLQIDSNVSLISASAATSVHATVPEVDVSLAPITAGTALGTFNQNGILTLAGVSANGVANVILPAATIIGVAAIGQMKNTLPVDAILTNTPIPANGNMSSNPVPCSGTLLVA